MFNSHALTLQYLQSLLFHLPDVSAQSTLVICKKVLNIVSTAEGYRIRLDLRIRVKPPEPRVYKSQIGIYCQGKQPKPSWYKFPLKTPQSTDSSASQLVNDWIKYTDYIKQYSQNDAIIKGLLRGFKEITETIRKCETCTRILVPIEDQYIDWDSAEFFALN